MNILEPDAAAEYFRTIIKRELAMESLTINIVGF